MNLSLRRFFNTEGRFADEKRRIAVAHAELIHGKLDDRTYSWNNYEQLARSIAISKNIHVITNADEHRHGAGE